MVGSEKSGKMVQAMIILQYTEYQKMMQDKQI